MDNNQINQSNDNAENENNTNQASQKPTDNQQDNSKKTKKGVLTLGVIIALLAGFGGGVLAAETTGLTLFENEQSEPTETTSQEEQEEQSGTVLEVPENAQVINECAEGRGKQFVKPENIPFGPVYGVWEDEITSVEYMLGKEDFLGGTDYINVDLMGAEYDHMNIGLLSEGHAGYPDPHYHVDVFTISHEESEQITCE